MSGYPTSDERYADAAMAAKDDQRRELSPEAKRFLRAGVYAYRNRGLNDVADELLTLLGGDR